MEITSFGRGIYVPDRQTKHQKYNLKEKDTLLKQSKTARPKTAIKQKQSDHGEVVKIIFEETHIKGHKSFPSLFNRYRFQEYKK